MDDPMKSSDHVEEVKDDLWDDFDPETTSDDGEPIVDQPLEIDSEEEVWGDLEDEDGRP